MHGPQTPFSQALHHTKYQSPGETFEGSQDRVAGALTTDAESYHAVREIFRTMRFMPGGRVQAGAGASKMVTLVNCFVAATITDSFVDDPGCIMDVAKEAATTMRMGGGIGYDFSSLRPRGSEIKKLRSVSSGPVMFMDIFDAICHATASSGNRRGAQMACLRVDHPDVVEFIQAKQNKHKLTGFNVSVTITDEFMEAVRDDKEFNLVWGGKVRDVVNARDLWDQIMRSTWDWAEPGVLFIDRINNENNLQYCEKIAASNPCGEEVLPPNGACLLGSFNLTKYVYQEGIHHALGTPIWGFNWNQLRKDIPYVVRAMDRVNDVSSYPLPAQKLEASNKRRIGIGVTGVANALEAIGHPYGSQGFLIFLEQVLTVIRDECYRASVELAEELGPFPLFDADKYLERPFIKALPEDIRDSIREHGIRNSHLLAIAPTGTISLCADNISSGIEPVFSYRQKRVVKTADGEEVQELEDYGVRVFGVQGKRASEVTPDEHLAVLSLAQKYVDSAVSKTINLPKDISWEDFKGVYMKAWEMGCKGCTTYRSGGKREAVLTNVDEPTPTGSCEMDPITGRRNCE